MSDGSVGMEQTPGSQDHFVGPWVSTWVREPTYKDLQMGSRGLNAGNPHMTHPRVPEIRS